MRKTFAEWVARVLNFTDGALALGAKPTSGQVLRYDGTSITGATMGGGGTPTPTAAGDMIGTTDGAAWVKRTAAQVRSDLNLSSPVVSASAPTVTDDSGDGYAVGQLWIVTTTKLAYILTDATAGAAVWRAVLGPLRLRMYVSGGVVYVVLESYSSGTWATVKGPAVVTKTAGTAALGVTASGTGLSYPAGYATLADQPSEGDQWIEALNGTGGLGVTWAPGTASSATWTIYASGDPGANYIRAAAYLGRSDLTSGFRIAYGRHIGTLVVGGQGNDIAEGPGQACTWDAPGVAWMAWRGATNIAEVGVGYGRRNGTMVATTGTAPSSALGSSLVFALVATRSALGGGTGALSGLEAIFYPAAGELSW